MPTLNSSHYSLRWIAAAASALMAFAASAALAAAEDNASKWKPEDGCPSGSTICPAGAGGDDYTCCSGSRKCHTGLLGYKWCAVTTEKDCPPREDPTRTKFCNTIPEDPSCCFPDDACGDSHGTTVCLINENRCGTNGNPGEPCSKFCCHPPFHCEQPYFSDNFCTVPEPQGGIDPCGPGRKRCAGKKLAICCPESDICVSSSKIPACIPAQSRKD